MRLGKALGYSAHGGKAAIPTPQGKSEEDFMIIKERRLKKEFDAFDSFLIDKNDDSKCTFI